MVFAYLGRDRNFLVLNASMRCDPQAELMLWFSHHRSGLASQENFREMGFTKSRRLEDLKVVEERMAFEEWNKKSSRDPFRISSKDPRQVANSRELTTWNSSFSGCSSMSPTATPLWPLQTLIAGEHPRSAQVPLAVVWCEKSVGS